jgi:hypothetical protein
MRKKMNVVHESEHRRNEENPFWWSREAADTNRRLRYLDKIATLSRDEVPRQLIACQATRPTKDYKFKKGSVLTMQSSYHSTLQELGLCKPSDGGALNSWMLNIVEHGMAELIDNKLGLTPGTFEKGRRKPLSIRKKPRSA